jgi:peptidyl-prolyl cis-trans isomerase SurA
MNIVKWKFNARAAARLAVLVLAAVAVAAPARAQEEGAARVVDEVIAQVNTDVVTLSMLKREMAEAAQALRQARQLTAEQAEAEVAKRRNEIIVTLINEQLLLQKGKELGLAEEVEKEVNRRMEDVRKQEGLRTIEQLEQAMTAAGVSPSGVRNTMRTEIMKQYVLGSEVDRKIFWSITDEAARSFFEKNRDKFRKPEALTLSEIYLSTVGKDDAEVKARAQQLVVQLRTGADFGALAAVQSEREDGKGQRVAPQTKGVLGTFPVTDITHEGVAAALRALKPGQVSDPVKMDQGYVILRLDARAPAGEATFDDRRVRETMTMERVDQERKTYVETLRAEAYVDVAPAYREAVLPLLKVEPVKTANAGPAKKDEKKKNDKKQ